MALHGSVQVLYGFTTTRTKIYRLSGKCSKIKVKYTKHFAHPGTHLRLLIIGMNEKRVTKIIQLEEGSVHFCLVNEMWNVVPIDFLISHVKPSHFPM